MVPPDYAMWLPSGALHSVEMLGDVSMRSVYVEPNAIEGLPERVRVVGMSPLMHQLIVETAKFGLDDSPTDRSRLVMDLLLHEIPNLPQQPLGLPFPSDARLAALCRHFLADPSPRARIDAWADEAGMSRRSFTRLFLRQTGLSLSTWRQQALLLAALPRLNAGESVTGIALDLGYDSVPAFTTMFKRVLGMSPRAYLRGTGDMQRPAAAR